MPRYFPATSLNAGPVFRSHACDCRKHSCALVSYRADRIRIAGCTSAMCASPAAMPSMIRPALFGQPFDKCRTKAEISINSGEGSGTVSHSVTKRTSTDHSPQRSPARGRESRYSRACKQLTVLPARIFVSHPIARGQPLFPRARGPVTPSPKSRDRAAPFSNGSRRVSPRRSLRFDPVSRCSPPQADFRRFVACHSQGRQPFADRQTFALSPAHFRFLKSTVQQ